MPPDTSTVNSPLFSPQDLLLIQQGLQHIINQCKQHAENLYKGQQNPDDSLFPILEGYSLRKKLCENLIAKLPLITDMQNVKASLLKPQTLKS